MPTLTKPNMNFSSPIIFLFLHFLLLVSLVCPVYSSKISSYQLVNQTFLQEQKFHKLKKAIATRLQQINKPAVKTIQSPDGDIIDCVMFHNQPAFDNPLLKEEYKQMDIPEIPKGHYQDDNFNHSSQLWRLSGESCPDGTIPIRRTKEEDLLRASSISEFGKKTSDFETNDEKFEYAVQYVSAGEFFGATAAINLWAPRLETKNEVSASKIWVAAGDAGQESNTIEVGWQVEPLLYGDNLPRLSMYWTNDGYGKTGCYNLLCSGFVQTNKDIVIGGAIGPTSTYKGPQFGIILKIWKDPTTRNWWLTYDYGTLVGYWPSSLFTHLYYLADEIQFGGIISNRRSTGSHTSTRMGSGHFPYEGFAKAAFFRDIQVLDLNNTLVPLSDPKTLISFPNCYDLEAGMYKGRNSFYYGGPGKNYKCL
ncbi:protein neprosin-like [Cicer arietinum]|uniref:protein neprosin-like n=1 Tax=Cicer arietinum TaxID=3827 RepID=UPI003CC5649A